MASASHDLRKLRACMVCGAARTFDQFKEEGCPNCEGLLAMQGSSDRVMDATTSSFSGLIAIISPAESWVARFQRLQRSSPGLYAAKVVGRLPEDIQQVVEARNIRPVALDGRR